MGYRHYVGMVSKKELPKLLEKMKNISDEDDPTFDTFAKFEFLMDNTDRILELGKLSGDRCNKITPLINGWDKDTIFDYEKTEYEYYIIKKPHEFLLELAECLARNYVDYIKNTDAIIIGQDIKMNLERVDLLKGDKKIVSPFNIFPFNTYLDDAYKVLIGLNSFNENNNYLVVYAW